MPSSVPAPRRRIPLEVLTQSAFAPFGAVIDNPNTSPRPNLERKIANQGTCQRWFDITHLANYYSSAPSRKPASTSMSFAICEPRKVRTTGKSQVAQSELVYDVEILERHPYTSQTFIPMGLSAKDSSTQYIVIVAPTLPVSHSSDRKEIQSRPKPYPTPDPSMKSSRPEVFARNRPEPYTNEQQPPTSSLSAPATSSELPRGPGLPDLNNIRAFLARGDQAVTYAAGAWHAPMAVIGSKPIEFVVIQHVNGVGVEDCQEIELKNDEDEGLAVSLDTIGSDLRALRAKL